MGDKTNISYVGSTWSPVSGCTKVSPECKNCYVERDWHRLTHLPAYQNRAFTDVACHEDRLDQPIRWKRPRRIFVCSMADLFHADVPDDFIDRVFAVMSLCPQHTFLVLSKQAARMQKYLSDSRRASLVEAAAERIARDRGMPIPDSKTFHWPLPNVWVGVTAGTQQSANERIPLLLETPAAVRWASVEPMLEPIRLTGLPGLPSDDEDVHIDALKGESVLGPRSEEGIPCARLDLVVCGGESGPKSRPMHPAWPKSLRDQCDEAGVPFFFKQWGEWIPGEDATNDHLNNPRVRGCWAHLAGDAHDGNNPAAFRPGDENMLRVGRKAANELLDGVEYKSLPAGATA